MAGRRWESRWVASTAIGSNGGDSRGRLRTLLVRTEKLLASDEGDDAPQGEPANGSRPEAGLLPGVGGVALHSSPHFGTVVSMILSLPREDSALGEWGT